MDQLDRKILSIFQNDTRRTAQSIGSEVGLSTAAVQRRLKRMRETHTIRAEIAQLNGAVLGVPITCIVTLSMAAPPKQLDNFKRQMRALPEVQQFYHVTGSKDFVLVVTASSMEAYGKFARKWFELNQNMARYETHVVLDQVKVGLSCHWTCLTWSQDNRRNTLILGRSSVCFRPKAGVLGFAVAAA